QYPSLRPREFLGAVALKEDRRWVKWIREHSFTYIPHLRITASGVGAYAASRGCTLLQDRVGIVP
ncbi:hypothetical protein Ancab_014895, partial [Ancistrocladus abbreviatus]